MFVLRIYASKEEEEVRFDKVLSIRDGKVEPLLYCMRVGLPFIARSTARFSKKYCNSKIVMSIYLLPMMPLLLRF